MNFNLILRQWVLPVSWQWRGDRGIYEFDQSGNLLTTILPADIDDGRSIVPQGIAFDDQGNFVVVSNLNEVIKFDGSGNFMMRFPTGPGTSRSTAFQACESQPDDNGECVPLGSTANESQTTAGTGSTDSQSGVSGGGGGGLSLLFLSLLLCLLIRPNRLARFHS